MKIKLILKFLKILNNSHRDMNKSRAELEMTKIVLKTKEITNIKKKINQINIPTIKGISNIKIILRLGKKTIEQGKIININSNKIINNKMMIFSKEDKMKKKCSKLIRKYSIKIKFNLMKIRLIRVKEISNRAKSSQ